MIPAIVALVVAVIVLGAIAFFTTRNGPPLGPAPSRDVRGVRSTLVFDHAGDGAPDAVVLDAISVALERAGAEPASWRADREDTVELTGLMLGDAFLLTLGPVSEFRWQLHVYAQPLGGPRYAAPPRTESMKTVLRAIDHAVRSIPDVHVIGWQSRQNAFHGQDAFAETPVD